MVMDASLRELRAFVAACDEGALTRAALVLHLSQPALSKQIMALEQKVGARLLERLPRGVRPTAAGRSLLPRARELVAIWDQAELELAAAAAGAGAGLTLGMTTALGRGLVPRLRRAYDAERGEGQLAVRQVLWEDPLGGLGGAVGDPGATDAAFCWLPVPHEDRFTWVELAREPVQLAMCVQHPLAGAERLSFAEIEDVPLLALPESAGPLRAFWLAEERRTRPARMAGVVHSVEEVAEAVAAQAGSCLVAAGNAPFLARPGITTVPVTDLPESRLALGWRREDRRASIAALARAATSLAGTTSARTGAPDEDRTSAD